MVYFYEIDDNLEVISGCTALSRGLEKLQVLAHSSLVALVTQKKAVIE